MLTSELRSFDEVGRIGGEEFAIIFPNTDARTASAACERLLAAIRTREIVTNAGTIPVTASIGISDSNIGVVDGTFLLELADRQLYIAKKAGRNRVAVDPAADSQAAAGVEMRPDFSPACRCVGCMRVTCEGSR